MKFWGVAASAVLLAGFVFAQETLSLKPKPKVGTEGKYKVNADISIMGNSATFSGVQHMKVVKTDDQGNYYVENSMSDVKVEFGGNAQEQPAEPPVTLKHSPLGEILEITGEKPSAADYRMAFTTNLIAPKGDAKVGTKWSVETKGIEKLGAVGIKADYEVTGAEEALGVKAITVKFSLKEVSGDTPMSATGTYWIDRETGLLVKADVDMKSVIMDPSIPPMDMKMKVEKAK